MPTKLGLDPRRLLPTGPHGWLIRTPGFTSREVRQRLRTVASDARGRAVANCAAQINAWLPPAPHFIDCPQHAWQHLPRIVFWYTHGDSLDEIAERIGSLSIAWGVERALDVACARMAHSLNRNPDAFGLPRCAWDNTPFPRLGRR